MKFKVIVDKIVSNKILQKKNIDKNDVQLLSQYCKLVDFLNRISCCNLNSVYFKYNGKYFLFICDNQSFYYVGNKKIQNKFYFQLF